MMSKKNNLNGGRSAVQQERQTNFKVVIRVRPPLPRELNAEVPFVNVVAVDSSEQHIVISENLEEVMDDTGNIISNTVYSTHDFAFDHVYDETSSQKKVYETTARTVVDSALHGYNATIFAYGQTGTGKTFTMEGFNRGENIEARGIIPRAIEQIFGHISQNASPRMRYLVRASYLQIYNEQISDLLKPERSNLTIREDRRRGVFVEGLSEWVVRSPAEIYGLMERGGHVRATGETKMNEASSRSHAVFIVIAEQSETVYVDDQNNELTAEEFQKFMHTRGVRREQDMARLESNVRQSFKVGKLNLVDLAGSERVRLSGATGQRLEESKQINRSLASLGNVISALTDAKTRSHIPYRDSKLTRMLEDSLGGNCKTTMMAMISPALESMMESLSTLKFANRAKHIKNEARVNEDLDQKSLLRKYERELKRLRAELAAKSKNVVDKRRLLELDEQRRRAEADKMAAIRALEARSLEFMREKEEKAKLEQQISALTGQMIQSQGGVGGTTKGGAVGEQGEVLRREYEGKLANLERERESIEEEKAQVDRYKQLLLKQRDIMIALTQRLVERDEQIMALQDELDAYDRHHKELEEKLDEKTASLIRLKRISMEVDASSPHRNKELSDAIAAAEVGSGGGDTGGLGGAREAIDLDAARLSSTSAAGDGGTVAAAKARAEADDLKKLVTQQRKQLAEMAQRNRELEEAASSSSSSSISNNSSRAAVQVLEQRVRELEGIRDTLQKKHHAHTSELNSATSRCGTLIKEREAVQTIMEQKIKVLVQSVSQAMAVVLKSTPQTPGSAAMALAKDVASLERLVNASISALRHASSSSSSSSSVPSSGNTNPLPPPPASNAHRPRS